MASPHFVQLLPPTAPASSQQLPQLPQYHYQPQSLPQHPASVTSPTGSTILTPTSANTIYSSPSSFPVKNEVDDRDGSIGAGDASEPSRKKQKRNKPTLSCHECVERKTKVSQPISLPAQSVLHRCGAVQINTANCVPRYMLLVAHFTLFIVRGGSMPTVKNKVLYTCAAGVGDHQSGSLSIYQAINPHSIARHCLARFIV